MFHPVCLFVCVCWSPCLCGRFIYEGLMSHKQYFAGTLLAMCSWASYVSHTHDVTDDVSRSHCKPNIKITISPSTFQLERRSKAQNIGNAQGYLVGWCFQLPVKKMSQPQNGDHFEILNTAPIWSQIWKDHPKLYPKKHFLWWLHHRWRHRVALKSVVPVYSFINETRTFFRITLNEQRHHQ